MLPLLRLAAPPKSRLPGPALRAERGQPARSPAGVARSPAMPVDLSGTWNLHSSDNFEGYMLALGRRRGPRRAGAVEGPSRPSRGRGQGDRACPSVSRCKLTPACPSHVLRPPAHFLD